MKRIAALMSVIYLLMTSILTGCDDNLGPKTETVIVDEETSIIELKVMHRWPPELGKMGSLLQETFREFDEANEDIVIKIDSMPSSMYEEQLNVRLASGEGPDVYAFWPGGRTEAMIRKGDIMDITELWEENDWYEVFKASVVAGSTHTDGRIYTLPIEDKPNTFWYNVEIFEEIGVEPPDTWDELMTVAEKCKEAGYIPFALGGKLTRWMPAFWFDYLLLNSAGGQFRDDLMWGKESWESEEVYKVFEMWKYTIDQGYFNEDMTEIDHRQASDLIAKGEAVMMLQGPWAINLLMDELGQMEPVEEFDLFAFPKISQNIPQAAEGAILSWAMNPNSDEANIEAAKRLLEYFADKEIMSNHSKERITLGSRNDIGYDIFDENIRDIMIRLDEETLDAPLYMNFELATLPPVQDAGMDGIIEFLDYPERYRAICARLERISRDTFD